MFSSIRYLIGNLTVRERDDIITVEGINVNDLFIDFRKRWKTSKLENWMFIRYNRTSLSFYRFFAPDFLYMVESIVREKRIASSRRSMDTLRKLLYQNTWLSNIEKEHAPLLDYRRLVDFKFQPLPHQKEFFETYDKLVPKYRLNGYMLAAAAGTGKTYTGLAVMNCRHKDAVVVVSPKNALDRVWIPTVGEIKTNPKWWASNSGKLPEPGCQYYIVHYEWLGEALERLSFLKGSNVGIILDESHNLNEITSQRTNNFVELCRMLESTDIIWASGTPIKALGGEAIPFLRSVDPFFHEKVEERFKKIYGNTPSRAIDILRNRLGLMMFKIDKLSVVDNQTSNEDISIKIPNGKDYTLERISKEMSDFIVERMAWYRNERPRFEAFYERCMNIHESKLRTPKDKSAYSQYRSNIKTLQKGYDPRSMKDIAMYCNAYELNIIIPSLPAELRAEFKSTRSVIKYVDLKVRGECLGRVLGTLRTQCHVDMVEHAGLPEIIENGRKKTVIFTSYVEVVQETQRYLTGLGYKPLLVYGDTNKDLKSIIAQFERDPNANPLIATFKSLSTAVPLVMADTCIIMNNPFRQHEYEQATARVDRLDQDGPVYIRNILLDTGEEANISTRSKDILEWSKSQVDAIMGTSYDDVVALEAYDETQHIVEIASDKTRLIAPASAAW